ncbi:hypothetical protein BLNAU_18154 [Blattamonas nauphoetae]|uniref:Uncharacterized protein n=1 Tax=Blattamonas nauphoetae TaxID=2049346 RepID=A0ABQ9X9Q4_9EUKA|nr:hypothetical protein BLNAU_18154 [Blattamonas nauphoetae]
MVNNQQLVTLEHCPAIYGPQSVATIMMLVLSAVILVFVVAETLRQLFLPKGKRNMLKVASLGLLSVHTFLTTLIHVVPFPYTLTGAFFMCHSLPQYTLLFSWLLLSLFLQVNLFQRTRKKSFFDNYGTGIVFLGFAGVLVIVCLILSLNVKDVRSRLQTTLTVFEAVLIFITCTSIFIYFFRISRLLCNRKMSKHGRHRLRMPFVFTLLLLLSLFSRAVVQIYMAISSGGTHEYLNVLTILCSDNDNDACLAYSLLTSFRIKESLPSVNRPIMSPIQLVSEADPSLRDKLLLAQLIIPSNKTAPETVAVEGLRNFRKAQSSPSRQSSSTPEQCMSANLPPSLQTTPSPLFTQPPQNMADAPYQLPVTEDKASTSNLHTSSIDKEYDSFLEECFFDDGPQIENVSLNHLVESKPAKPPNPVLSLLTQCETPFDIVETLTRFNESVQTILTTTPPIEAQGSPTIKSDSLPDSWYETKPQIDESLSESQEQRKEKKKARKAESPSEKPQKVQKVTSKQSFATKPLTRSRRKAMGLSD